VIEGSINIDLVEELSNESDHTPKQKNKNAERSSQKKVLSRAKTAFLDFQEQKYQSNPGA